jgi:predicted esterase
VCLALGVAFGVVLGTFTSLAAARPEARAHRVGAQTNARSDDHARAKVPAQPLVLHDDDGTILAFPPRAAAAKRPMTVVYLHGVHGRPENGCPWLRDGASELGWLVCPRANERLPNDTFSWSGSVAQQRAVVARAERAAVAEGADGDADGVLVGFSQGAFVALDLTARRLGQVRGLVLIGADVSPSRAMLEASGVNRIVLAAGDLDASSAPMKRAAEHLRREGVDVRFVSLGRIGHSYATTEKEALRDAIVWAGSSS